MNGPSSTSLYRLERAGINTTGGVLLEDLSWELRAKAVTVLLGPSGTGKSSLLRALAGRALPSGWSLRGGWRYRDDSVTLGKGLPGVVLHAQRPAKSVRASGPAGIGWRAALRGGTTALLDEPGRNLEPDEGVALIRALRRHRQHSAAVVVTHNLSFAKSIADYICLICDGKSVAHGPADQFFENPPNELASRFVRTGNCWPSAPRPQLPSHFCWVVDGALAGMGRPGLLRDVEDDLAAIAEAGVTQLISLTTEPFSPHDLKSFGVAGRHFPIVDMQVPALGPTARLCREIERNVAAGEVVAVHCRAGLGRTGTIVASYLVWKGMSPDAAIEEVRRRRPGYIQNRQQEQFVHRFSESV